MARRKEMKAVRSSETLVNIYLIAGDKAPESHDENLKFNNWVHTDY
jgi:hypothetical protein